MTKTMHINELIASRRALLGGFVGLPLLSLGACATSSGGGLSGAAGFASIAATNADTVTLPPGYSWRTLIAWGDALFDSVDARFDPNALNRSEQEQRFGMHNDMLALFAADYAFPPPNNPERMILCANNEYASAELMYPAAANFLDYSAAQVETLYASIGVSVVELQKRRSGWAALRNPAPGQGKNRRITAFTPVLFSGPAANHPWLVAAAQAFNSAEPDRSGGAAPAGVVRCGTGANCAGGLTPWGTYLTAEENFNFLFAQSGDSEAQNAARADQAYVQDATSFGYPTRTPFPAERAPQQFQISQNPYGPAAYGWIVEIDPHDATSTPKKRTALGRKKNECATTALTRDGRVAVYMGDDQRNEYAYKFITSGRFNSADRAANMDLLDTGDLYCARFLADGSGEWIKITAEAANAAAAQQNSPVRFRDQADALVRAREAAKLLGATPLDRPEDIEALHDAEWRGLGPVLIACTNNSGRDLDRPGAPSRESAAPSEPQSNLPGHILRLDEADGDVGALRFTWDVFAMGGDPNAQSLTVPTRAGDAHVSTRFNGRETVSGARFACPDNMFIDSDHRVWIATDGSDLVFGDCNDGVLMTPASGEGPRPMKRFLVGPVGCEICGPLMAPDERAFFCAIQHPGETNTAGDSYAQMRVSGARPPSSFPDGGNAWPRSAVIVVTRDDQGRIGD